MSSSEHVHRALEPLFILCHAMLLTHFSNDSNQTASAILWLHISGVDPGRTQPLVDRWWDEHQGQRGSEHHRRAERLELSLPLACQPPGTSMLSHKGCWEIGNDGWVKSNKSEPINQREYKNNGNWKRTIQTIQRNCVISLMSLYLICLPPFNYNTSYITHILNAFFQSCLMGKAEDWAHASEASVVSKAHVDKTECSAVKYYQAPRSYTQ